MKRIEPKFSMRRLVNVAVFVSFSIGLWGQVEPSSTAHLASAVTASAGPSVTATDLAKPHDDSFVIGNDDVLAINVWKEPDISRSIPVRSDGRISLPLVGEVQASGQTPLKLEVEMPST